MDLHCWNASQMDSRGRAFVHRWIHPFENASVAMRVQCNCYREIPEVPAVHFSAIELI